ncbi:MAG: alpha/beta hydrolase [Bacteroidetes bacterium]|nr:alpha/beta hydrolase [Bacteroidota bacterium]
MLILTALFFVLFFLSIFLFLSFRHGNPVHDMVRLPAYWVSVNKGKQGFATPETLSYGPSRQQYLLFVEEKSKGADKPAVFFIHGGGWQFGKPAYFLPHAEVLAAAGYPVYLLCHRKIPRYDVRHMQEDLDLGLKTCLTDLNARYGNQHPLILGGMSSGGNLSALKFLRDNNRDRILAGFFFAAPLDLDKMRMSLPIMLFAGRRQTSKYKTANPINYIDPEDKRPVLIMHGLRDGIVEPETSVSFFLKRNKTAPHSTQLVLWPEGNHFYPANWSFENGPVQETLLRWLSSCQQQMTG